MLGWTATWTLVAVGCALGILAARSTQTKANQAQHEAKHTLLLAIRNRSMQFRAAAFLIVLAIR